MPGASPPNPAVADLRVLPRTRSRDKHGLPDPDAEIKLLTRDIVESNIRELSAALARLDSILPHGIPEKPKRTLQATVGAVQEDVRRLMDERDQSHGLSNATSEELTEMRKHKYALQRELRSRDAQLEEMRALLARRNAELDEARAATVVAAEAAAQATTALEKSPWRKKSVGSPGGARRKSSGVGRRGRRGSTGRRPSVGRSPVSGAGTPKSTASGAKGGDLDSDGSATPRLTLESPPKRTKKGALRRGGSNSSGRSGGRSPTVGAPATQGNKSPSKRSVLSIDSEEELGPVRCPICTLMVPCRHFRTREAAQDSIQSLWRARLTESGKNPPAPATEPEKWDAAAARRQAAERGATGVAQAIARGDDRSHNLETAILRGSVAQRVMHSDAFQSYSKEAHDGGAGAHPRGSRGSGGTPGGGTPGGGGGAATNGVGGPGSDGGRSPSRSPGPDEHRLRGRDYVGPAGQPKLYDAYDPVTEKQVIYLYGKPKPEKDGGEEDTPETDGANGRKSPATDKGARRTPVTSKRRVQSAARSRAHSGAGARKGHPQRAQSAGRHRRPRTASRHSRQSASRDDRDSSAASGSDADAVHGGDAAAAAQGRQGKHHQRPATASASRSASRHDLLHGGPAREGGDEFAPPARVDSFFDRKPSRKSMSRAQSRHSMGSPAPEDATRDVLSRRTKSPVPTIGRASREDHEITFVSNSHAQHGTKLSGKYLLRTPGVGQYDTDIAPLGSLQKKDSRHRNASSFRFSTTKRWADDTTQFK